MIAIKAHICRRRL